MQKKITLFLVPFFIVACNTNFKRYETGEELSLNLQNKANFCFEGKESLKMEEVSSLEIYKILNDSSIEINEKVYVNINYGYIEVTNNKKFLFYVIFSDNNGPIISYDNKYFKNNELIKKIILCLEMKLKNNADSLCYEKIVNALNS